eukprot:3638926-Ditylum_brightwellii.AAC.1
MFAVKKACVTNTVRENYKKIHALIPHGSIVVGGLQSHDKRCEMSVNQKIFKKKQSTKKIVVGKRSQVEVQASAMPTGYTTESSRKQQKVQL